MATSNARSGATRPPHQLLALVIGAVYLLAGLAGFFVTGFSGFTEHDPDQTLLGFAVNPLHNIVHLLIGGLGLYLARTPAGARTFGWALLLGYGLAFLYGLFAVNADWDFLNINWADNILHLVSAAAGAAIAFWPGARSDGHSRIPGSTRPVS